MRILEGLPRKSSRLAGAEKTFSKFAKITPPAVAQTPPKSIDIPCVSAETLQKHVCPYVSAMRDLTNLEETLEFFMKEFSRPRAGSRDGENLRRFSILGRQHCCHGAPAEPSGGGNGERSGDATDDGGDATTSGCAQVEIDPHRACQLGVGSDFIVGCSL